MLLLAMVLAAAVVLLIVLGWMRLSYVRERREIMSVATFRERYAREYGYDYVLLSDGITTYQVLNRASSSMTIAFIHGATIGSLTYMPLARELASRGHRVIIFDGFGRGLSDRIRQQPLSMAVLVRQLRELLRHLGVERVVLYGTSLGAAIAARFGACHPELVLAIGFEAPLLQPPPSWSLMLLGMAARSVPPLGRWLARMVMVPLILERGECLGEGEEERQMTAHFRMQFTVEGHEADLLTLLTGDAVRADRMPDHAAIGVAGVPVHFAYALDDREMPRAVVEAAVALHRQPNVVAYPEGGHFFGSGRHTQLAAEFDRFLRARLDVPPHRQAREALPPQSVQPSLAELPMAAVTHAKRARHSPPRRRR